MNIDRVAYAGFEVSNIKAWREFSATMLGTMEADASETEARFRIDSRSWRYAVHQGEADDLQYLGLEVRDAEALSAMKQRLEAGGLKVTVEGAEFIAQREVTEAISCTDPFGLRLEIFFGATEVFEKPFASPLGVTNFVTGSQGFGHLVLSVPDVAKAEAFYMGLLGFKRADVIDWSIGGGTVRLSFYYCNGRHHSLALASMPGPKRLHHFMLEAGALDDVGLAYDRFQDKDAVVMTLGRHTNDHMFSFYGATPSGFAVEFGWGARIVDPDWMSSRHTRISVWGHRPAKSAQ